MPHPDTNAPGTLDLRAPDIERVFPQSELQKKLPEPGDEEHANQDTVQVAGTREHEATPVAVGLLALPWAIIHPTQAWRVFMPLPAGQTAPPPSQIQEQYQQQYQ